MNDLRLQHLYKSDLHLKLIIVIITITITGTGRRSCDNDDHNDQDHIEEVHSGVAKQSHPSQCTGRAIVTLRVCTLGLVGIG